MAKVWIEDRAEHTDYIAALAAAKAAGRKATISRWRVRWYDLSNAPKAKSFKTKPAAETYRTQIEARMGDGSYRDPAAGRVRLADVAETWLASRVDVKRSTRVQYKETLDTYVIPRWGAVPVDMIRYEDVAAWIGTFGVEPGVKGRLLGAARIRGIHRVLSMVMGWAVKTGRIAVNPAAGVPLPRKNSAEHVYLGHVEVEKLAQAAGEYRVLLHLLAYTGLRWGEASAIRVGRVDLAAHRVDIVEAWGDDDGELYLDTPKGHERRKVPLPAFLALELKPFLTGREPDELLFAAPRGGPLRYHNFRSRVFDPAVKASGVPAVTPHKLRHTAASLAIASGADVKVVQTMLGHKSATETLDTYGHLWPDRLDEVSKRLDRSRKAAIRKAETENREEGSK